MIVWLIISFPIRANAIHLLILLKWHCVDNKYLNKQNICTNKSLFYLSLSISLVYKTSSKLFFPVLERPSRFAQDPPLLTRIEADTRSPPSPPPIYNTLVKSCDASTITAASSDHLQS